MSSVSRSRVHQAWALAVYGGVIISGAACATEPEEEVTWNSVDQDIEATGDALPGIPAADFTAAKAAFNTVEALVDGLGPVFNERACGNCHTQGASGGAGVQIERRFGRFVNGVFDDLDNRGGSLRQLFSVGRFTGLN